MPDLDADLDLICPECGYSLRGIDSARCPECGTEIDRTRLGESIIPWLHRRQIGRFKGFWRTVNLLIIQPRSLAREMNLPARFDDAVRFRRVVVLHAFVPAAVIASFAVVLSLTTHVDFWFREDVLGSVLQTLMIPIAWVCLGLFFFAMTGVCSYFFHPRRLPVVRQNRAIALSYYACAPLAYLPVVIVLLFVGTMAIGFLGGLRTSSFLWLSALILLFTFAPLGIIVLALIRTPETLIQVTTHCGTGRRLVVFFGLPLIWLGLGLLLLVVVPIMCLAIMLMILSWFHP